MKTAIVHDWLNGRRGGERVLETLLELHPNATIYTLFYERGTVSPAIARRRIVTSWLDRLPGVYRFYRNLAPLFPAAIGSLKLDEYDLVISSSHAAAKAVNAGAAPHISYCHTPMRYIWDAAEDYSPGAIRRLALAAVGSRLRHWDQRSADRVHYFIANSRFVQDRIRRHYGRDAAVIHPPVDTRFFTPAGERRDGFYLAAGALVPYKRIDLVVHAFNQLRKQLIVTGTGPEASRLRKIAGSTVKFTGWVEDSQLRDLYRRARAVVVAARDDFGIAPVEAQSCGCPVIAFAAGGSLETVRDGESGIFFNQQHPDAIANAIRRFETRHWPEESVRSHVEGFSREVFKLRFESCVRSFLDGKAATA